MPDFFSTETCRQAFDDRPHPRISYGQRFPEACVHHVENTFKASRVYVLASKSLSSNTTALTRLQAALGKTLAGTRIGISSHTPMPECLEMINAAGELDIDCLVTLGAGSLTDAAKVVRWALANGAYDLEALNTLWGGRSHNPSRRQQINDPEIPMICIPTSLSGGEYASNAGATDTVSLAKRIFETKISPELVIQDPELCTTTPEWVWLSTGIRAVDHCVETLCSLQSNAQGDRRAHEGLAKLIPGLLKCRHHPRDLAVRHLCQLGVVDAMSAVSSGVPLGASHAIGHQLGPLGVGHGETSCVILPAVCKFNRAQNANTERQVSVVDFLLEIEEVTALLRERSINTHHVELCDVLDAVIRELGMPRTLKEVKIGRDKLDVLAENTLHDIWSRTNPVPITTKEQVMQILEMVVE